MNLVRLQAVVMPLLEVFIGISSLVTLIYGGYLAIVGEITLGRFVAFYQYVNMLVWPMLACGDAINTFAQGGASIKRVQAVMEQEPGVQDMPDLFCSERASETWREQDISLTGQITFSHLTYTHKGAPAPDLQDICLEVPAGTTLAVIGRTGSGKSTLVNLMLHLYNTERGMILLDGRDINTIPLSSLRRQIAYVPQDNFLFSDTLKANIAFGVEGQDMERIVAATTAACIHDSIMEFPEGYDTVVGERGVTLSGGQKQRSSIARALMKDAPILILDDALSAVDTDTEEQLLRNLHENRRGKTTIRLHMLLCLHTLLCLHMLLCLHTLLNLHMLLCLHILPGLTASILWKLVPILPVQRRSLLTHGGLQLLFFKHFVIDSLLFHEPGMIEERVQAEEHVQAEERVQAEEHVQAEERVQVEGHVQAEEHVQVEGHVQVEEHMQAEGHVQAEERVQTTGKEAE